MEEAVLGLRGGDGLTDVVAVIALVIFMNWYDSLFGVEAFQANPLPHQDVFGWLNGKYNSKNVVPSGFRPTTYLEMKNPASIPHQDFTGLTKEQKKNLPDLRDGSIDVEGHPKLIVRYGQVYFKTPKHGSIHGLLIDENERTPKTEQNALDLHDSLVERSNREVNIFFDNVGYQRGTKRGYDSVNLDDKNERVIAVYKKQENGEYLFSNTCKLTPMEENSLI